MSSSTERAVLAGGCFWGMQDLIRKLPGVLSTRVGYTGGDVPNATYRNHGTHAEGIEIIFDPDQISYRQILEYFFQIHDPTTLNRQGNDRGASYRSAIYFASDGQAKVAAETIDDVNNFRSLARARSSPNWSRSATFWEAEPEHQDYLERYSERLHLPLSATRIGDCRRKDQAAHGRSVDRTTVRPAAAGLTVSFPAARPSVVQARRDRLDTKSLGRRCT